MATEYSFPRIRAILDEAVASEFGISIAYDSWTTAFSVRRNAYKIRDMQRREARKTFPDPIHPSHGVSAYDGLQFWLRSSVKRTNMRVVFLSEAECDEQNEQSKLEQEALFDTLNVGEAYAEPFNKAGEREDLFPGKALTLYVETEKGTAIAENAPSFKAAWDIVCRDFPCSLVIENGYSLDHLEITRL